MLQTYYFRNKHNAEKICFKSNNSEDYNKSFTIAELKDSNKRSLNIAICLDKVQCEFIKQWSTREILRLPPKYFQQYTDKQQTPRYMETDNHNLQKYKPRKLPAYSIDKLPLNNHGIYDKQQTNKVSGNQWPCHQFLMWSLKLKYDIKKHS